MMFNHRLIQYIDWAIRVPGEYANQMQVSQYCSIAKQKPRHRFISLLMRTGHNFLLPAMYYSDHDIYTEAFYNLFIFLVMDSIACMNLWHILGEITAERTNN